MFFSVIVGYVLSALFAFAGALQIVEYVKHVDRSQGYGPFIDGLAGSCIWLGVSVALVLLIQIASFLEKLVIQSKKLPLPDLGPTKPARPQKHEQSSAPASSASPAPVSGQSKMATTTPPPVETSSTAADPEAPRVPDLPGSASSTSTSSTGQEDSEERGLHYFKM